MTRPLSSVSPNAPCSRNTERGNLNIRFKRLSTLKEPVVSERWELAGRQVQFVQLPPNDGLGLDQNTGRIFVKVIIGALASPSRTAFFEPRQPRDTTVGDAEIVAGPEGALIAVFTETKGAPQAINSMDQLRISGPSAEILRWESFHERFEQYTDLFKNADAYIGPGFHLLDDDGEEIVFVHFWTAGKGVDLSTHNHGQDPSPQMPAFAETHLTIFNGTGSGGMYQCAEPGALPRHRLPMPPRFEHGPFFDFDARTGAPTMNDNGAVRYPWHGWEAGKDDRPGQSYDVVAAFETAPRYTNVLS